MLLKQERSKLWIGVLLCTLLLAVAVLAALPVEAAALPYTYSFDTEDKKEENNKMVIHFESGYLIDNYIDKDKIYVADAKKSELPIPIIREPDVNINDQTITITFKNVGLLDNEVTDYVLRIPKKTIRFDQIEEFKLPFSIFDIKPGFKSTFIDNEVDNINDEVFKDNAPRDIYVHVPKAYITDIETIHRNEGLAPEDDSDPNPNLTNIDVLTERVVERLKVSLAGSGNLSVGEENRDLTRRKDLNGFTAGYAGLEAGIEGNENSTGQEINLQAYDKDGKLLEERDFKLRVKDTDKDFILNDYIDPIPGGIFGEKKTLYELMKDPQLLENIISRIPVNQLDRLGLTYEYQDPVAKVGDEEGLLMALANKNIKKIELNGDIELSGPLTIEREVEITGVDGDRIEIEGNVTIGKGNNIKVTLRNIEIVEGDLTINAGKNGTVVLDNVDVDYICKYTSGELILNECGKMDGGGNFGGLAVVVGTKEMFNKALANDGISSIALGEGINELDKLTIERSIKVIGASGGTTITGAVTLGTGSKINVTLKNMEIKDDLTINPGNGGTVALDSVIVTGYPQWNSGKLQLSNGSEIGGEEYKGLAVKVDDVDGLEDALGGNADIIVLGESGGFDLSELDEQGKLTIERSVVIVGETKGKYVTGESGEKKKIAITGAKSVLFGSGGSDIIILRNIEIVADDSGATYTINIDTLGGGELVLENVMLSPSDKWTLA